MLSLHQNTWPRRPAKQGNDLLRAIVVLAISSLDSYIHDIILENAPGIAIAFAQGKCNPPGKLIEAITPALVPEKALKLIARRRPDEEIRKIVAAHIKERTFQDPGQIESALKLIDLGDFWEALRVRLKLASKTKAKEYLVEYIKRRHQIVHEADTYKSKKYHNRLRPITRPMVQKCIRETTRFVNQLDKVVVSHVEQVLGNAPVS